MARARVARNTAVVLASLAVVLVLSGLIGAGVLDRYARDGRVDWRSAIGALAAYWILLFTGVWLVPLALRHRRAAALCACGTMAAFGIAEVGARRFVPGSTEISAAAGGFQSREFHHLYPPHVRRYMGRVGGTPIFLETNEDGLRTAYSRDEFRRHDHRVIVLGDSFTFGLGVASEEAFPARMEARLRDELDGTVAVLNAGVISYSPFLQKLLLQKKLLEYRPTVVVLVLDVTDIGDDDEYMSLARRSGDTWEFPFEDAAPVRYYGAAFELVRLYVRRFYLALTYPLRLAGYPIGRRADYHDFEITINGVQERNRFFVYRHPLAHTKPYFDRTMANIDDIAALAAGVGARFALAVSPRFHHWNANECPDNWERDQYGLAEPYQFEYFRYFDEASRAYPIINLLHDFRATDRFPLVFPDDPHWNAAGHAFAAEAIVKHLSRLELAQAGAR